MSADLPYDELYPIEDDEKMSELSHTHDALTAARDEIASLRERLEQAEAALRVASKYVEFGAERTITSPASSGWMVEDAREDRRIVRAALAAVVGFLAATSKEGDFFCRLSHISFDPHVGQGAAGSNSMLGAESRRGARPQADGDPGGTDD